MPAMIDTALTAPDFRGIHAEPSFSGIQSFYRRRYTKALAGATLASDLICLYLHGRQA